MFCDHILMGLWKGLLHAFKHEQINLLFSFPKGHPLHTAYLEKTQATEKAAKGLEVLLRGGSSEPATEGFNAMIQALDTLAQKVDPQMQSGIFEERAYLISIREKLKRLEEIIALPEGEEDFIKPIDPKCMN